MTVKAYVDQDVCIGCGLCTGIAPEVFDMNADGKAQAVGDCAGHEDAVREAAESCPVGAIRRED